VIFSCLFYWSRPYLRLPSPSLAVVDQALEHTSSSYSIMESQRGQPWWVWAAVWLGTLTSLVTIVIYVLVLDIDLPALKPRPILENAAACIIYFSHGINIVTSLVVTLALLQFEFTVVLFYIGWCLLHIVINLILCILSSFTVLGNKPGRFGLHALAIVFALFSIFVMFKRYRSRNKPYWDSGEKSEKKGEVNQFDISRESNIM